MAEDILENLEKVGRVLHQRLVGGDVTATTEVAELFMPVIVNRLTRGYPNLDPHLIGTAVEDALISYFRRPEQYDPDKLDLAGYLRMSAYGDLKNLLEREKQVTDYVSLDESVELSDGEAEHRVEAQDDFDLESLVLEHLSPIWPLLSDLLPDPVDQEIVLLMMEGERRTSIYSDVLDLSGCLPEEQARIVKRHKDRIKKKIQRNISQSEVSNNG